MAIILDGKDASGELTKRVRRKIRILGYRPTIAVLSVGKNDCSDKYIRSIERQARTVGADCDVLRLDADNTKESLEKVISTLNSSWNGILLLSPMPRHLLQYMHELSYKIDPDRDVDGAGERSRTSIVNGKYCLAPCTASGIISLLEYYKIPLSGKTVTIVGEGYVVGIPLAVMLSKMKDPPEINVFNSKATNPSQYTRIADVVVLALGKENYLRADMIKESGVVVVDAGVCRCYEDDVVNKAARIIPASAVGRITTAKLFANLYDACRMQEKHRCPPSLRETIMSALDLR